ncbi:hypothetical protein ATANTOWER_005764, partial [Ataeniobius toweri]|nr:hypothetical protein [Ataeniobius toweri]
EDHGGPTPSSSPPLLVHALNRLIGELQMGLELLFSIQLLPPSAVTTPILCLVTYS